jgi:hypothetical protein
MTEAGIKTEDYREINEYWVKRLTKSSIDPMDAVKDILAIASSQNEKKRILTEENTPDHIIPKPFLQNVMTLGYPKSTDTHRILTYEHKGIIVGKGNPYWGADPNKFYFIIKHGKRIS